VGKHCKLVVAALGQKLSINGSGPVKLEGGLDILPSAAGGILWAGRAVDARQRMKSGTGETSCLAASQPLFNGKTSGNVRNRGEIPRHGSGLLGIWPQTVNMILNSFLFPLLFFFSPEACIVPLS